MRTYTTRDLDLAERDAARARHLDAPHAAHDRARHAAMAAAFGIDPSQTIDLDGSLTRLVDQFAQWRRTLDSPFSSYLEAPPMIIDLYQRYGHEIGQQVNGLVRTVDALLADARARIATVPRDATITDDDLRAHGFDPDDQDGW